MTPLVAPLFDGPIDIVGDIHGEIEPLEALLGHLGYDAAGGHRQGRRLVFVGDLGDRGPDSPAVIERVRTWVEAGVAQCLLGNHELNLLRGAGKPGNRWFIDPTHAEARPGGEFADSRPAPQALKSAWLDFFATLPLALERTDLRVAHAAWVPGEIAALRVARGAASALYDRYEAETVAALEREGLVQAAEAERARWHHLLHDVQAPPPLLTALGELDERYQMGNPVRVVTSGVERLARRPFWSHGRWRMCDRVRWWDDYADGVPVVVGHYWRQVRPVRPLAQGAVKPELFEACAPTDWVGRDANVFCVDFSVGARYQERRAGLTRFDTHLAALRWPECELWFETGLVGSGAPGGVRPRHLS